MPTPAAPTYIDLRGKLRVHKANAKKWLRLRAVADILYWFVHYSAGNVPPNATQAQEIKQLEGIANLHINKDWGNGAFGWTAMYHWCIGPSGAIYILNDLTHILWNTSNGNPMGAATMLLLGAKQKPTPAQLASLGQHLDWQTSLGWTKASPLTTFGHGECGKVWGEGPNFKNATECPGEHILAWTRLYRKGGQSPMPTPTNRFFPETGQFISHGFKEFWEAEPKAMLYFGLPIGPEQAETLTDGKTYTVQYFERCRMEFHPEAQAPFKIQLGLLGAELQAHKTHSSVGGH